ncbi:hypothetical protein [Xylanivirga thermophila]|jgi:hypothetical protein|uniref:hypothetical protein n=1 Tax=Xylanivirga thermophila TaxID=2496273 RepID=UPI00101C88D3|nr:hypothetical protein [Xylanivirga thermophila]
MDEKDKENKNIEIEDENNGNSEENEEGNYLAVGMCLGICFGMIVSCLFFKNIGMGMFFRIGDWFKP